MREVKNMKTSYAAKTAAVISALSILLFSPMAQASHSWGNYHWARTSNPFTLKLGDNLSSAWDPYLATTSADWSLSSVLDTTIVPGKTKPKLCRPSAGQVEVCNATYGRNGWLGIASIWASGNHITQGTVKINDTYFNTAAYNSPAWRNLVMCQEVGHTFGLDHQDEDFANPNLDTCMDYTNSPSSNQHPNQHDYEMLETIYSHLDATATISQTRAANTPNEVYEQAAEWGKTIHTSRNGKAALYMRDFGKGQKLFTFVIWADNK